MTPDIQTATAQEIIDDCIRSSKIEAEDCQLAHQCGALRACVKFLVNERDRLAALVGEKA